MEHLLFFALLMSASLGVKIITPEQTVKVEIGENATIECMVQDMDGQNIGWTKDGNILAVGDTLYASDERYSLDFDRAAGKFNLIVAATTLADDGTYRCDVMGANPKEQVDQQLEVQVAPSVKKEPADDPIPPVKIGDTLLLKCDPSGKPIPTVTWQRVGAGLTEGNNNLPMNYDRMFTGSNLMLTDIQKDFAGTYTCTATNGVGFPKVESFKVNVLFAPEVTTPDASVYFGVGNQLQLMCNFDGFPIPDVTWTINGENVEDRHNMNVAKNTVDGKDAYILTVDNFSKDDYGVYTCTGQNSEGSANETVKVLGTPQAVKIISDSEGTYGEEYVITWTSNQHNAPVNYTIKYMLVDDQNNQTWTTLTVLAKNQEGMVQEQSYTLTGLQPMSLYQATVTAANEFGKGDESALFTFRTAEADQTPPPTTPSTTLPSTENETSDSGKSEESTGASSSTWKAASKEPPTTPGAVSECTKVASSIIVILATVVAQSLC